MVSIISSALMLPVFTNASDSDVNTDHACQSIRASGNAEYPPYLWRTENSLYLSGAIKFLLDELATEINTDIELIYSGPWGRVQEDVAAGRIDMIAGAFFTLPRTHYMDYIYPEMLQTKTAVWTNEKNHFQYAKWDDLQSYHGVTVLNNSFGQEFDEYAKRYLNIEEVASLEQGLRMLSGARVDYLLYEENPGKAYAKKLNINNLHVQPIAITRQKLYLTMSKQSPCNTTEVRKKISQALTNFTEQERIADLLKRAHESWASKQQVE